MLKILNNSRIPILLIVVAVLILLSACAGNPRYNSTKNTASKQTVIKTAKNMLGTKYRYGGTSPKRGFDCSGLVQYSHKAAGIKLPRTTRAQYKAAKPVPRRYLKAGDLVFFKTAISRVISHVGIYLGNNKFIHAPSSGKRVKISSMKEKYWRKRFIAAGRIF